MSFPSFASRVSRPPFIYPERRASCNVRKVKSVIKSLPGGSQSRLVLCDDGRLYVLKMHPNPQGPNVLANEALGALLLHGLGLPAPKWKRISIDLHAVELFADFAMTAADNNTSFPMCGLHFASEHLGSPDCNLIDLMPRSEFRRVRQRAELIGIQIFDIWASHQDERQCVYRRPHSEGLYDVYFIDNGHLFGGPRWSEMMRPSRAYAFGFPPIIVNSPEVVAWFKLFESRLPKLLYHALTQIPKYWYEGDIYRLFARLLDRLDNIRTLVERDSTSRSLSSQVLNMGIGR